VLPALAAPPERRWRRLAPTLVGALLLAGFVLLGFLRTAHRPLPALLAITPVTALPGLEYDPAFSPDGSRVAFLRVPDSRQGGEMTLEVQLLGAESSLRLTEEAADFGHPIESPAWSPDGASIAYLRWRREEGWGIYRISALGGVERKILDLGTTEVSGLGWSPNGRWLALGWRSAPGEALALYRIDLETLERLRLTDPPATIGGDRLPAWSPDGSSVAFVRTLASDVSEVRIVSAGGGGSRSLLPEPHKVADLDWSADGRQVLVAVHEGGRHRIWGVDVATGAVRRLNELGRDARWLTVARRTGQLAYGQARWELGIRRYDLVTGEPTPLPGIASTFYEAALDVSPAGDRLTLVSTRSGSPEVWIDDLEGGRPLQLTRFAGPTVGHPRWVMGGESIIFQVDQEGGSNLWKVGTDGAAPRRLTDAEGDERAPSLARDGRSIYFASSRSGEWQVWRRPVAVGPAVQVTTNGGYFAQESPDGEWLYFTRWQTGGLWRIPAGGGEEVRVLGDELSSHEWGNWAVTPEGIWLVTWDSGSHAELALVASESGEVTRRFPLAGTPVRPGLALAPDAESVVLAEVDRIESDIVLIEGLDGWLR
jgi:Tol biopolymer transport system component